MNRRETRRQRKIRLNEEATARNAAFQALTLEEQLEKVRNAPGESRKQTVKIERQIILRDTAAQIEASKEAAKANQPKKAPRKGGKPAGKNIKKTPA